jgi:hypothetical protein
MGPWPNNWTPNWNVPAPVSASALVIWWTEWLFIQSSLRAPQRRRQTLGSRCGVSVDLTCVECVQLMGERDHRNVANRLPLNHACPRVDYPSLSPRSHALGVWSVGSHPAGLGVVTPVQSACRSCAVARSFRCANFSQVDQPSLRTGLPLLAVRSAAPAQVCASTGCGRFEPERGRILRSRFHHVVFALLQSSLSPVVVPSARVVLRRGRFGARPVPPPYRLNHSFRGTLPVNSLMRSRNLALALRSTDPYYPSVGFPSLTAVGTLRTRVYGRKARPRLPALSRNRMGSEGQAIEAVDGSERGRRAVYL